MQMQRHGQWQDSAANPAHTRGEMAWDSMLPACMRPRLPEQNKEIMAR